MILSSKIHHNQNQNRIKKIVKLLMVSMISMRRSPEIYTAKKITFLVSITQEEHVYDKFRLLWYIEV